MKKDRNIVKESATMLLEQMTVISNANRNNIDLEVKKAQSMAALADPIARYYEAEVKIIIGANYLPKNSMVMLDAEDIDNLNMSKTLGRTKPNSLMIEEFTKPGKR